MHELSLAENMIDAALQADGVRAEALCALNINCGALSGANAESLRFCLELVCERNGLTGVRLNIVETPAGLRCGCGRRYDAGTLFCTCPECGGSEHEVVAGADVLLESVEVEDD